MIVHDRVSILSAARRLSRLVLRAVLLVGLGAAASCHGEPGGPQSATRWVQVVAGGWHTCALTDAGSLYCWGAIGSGQLGSGSSDDPSSPVLIPTPSPLHNLVAGSGHACGLTADGAAYCWGSNDSGQVGDGSTVRRGSPTLVAGGLVFRNLAAGSAFTQRMDSS